MTNAEYYLKENITPYEFAMAFNRYWFDNERGLGGSPADKMQRFLKRKATTTLTEDERVILRNMKVKGSTAEYIRRVENTGYLQVYARCGVVGANFANIDIYSHLFQFIKEGEEYEIKELLGDEK